LRPSTAAFSLAALFAVIGSISYSFSLVLNKVLARTGDASLVTYHAVASLIGAGAISAFSWIPVGWAGLSAMLLLGVIGAVAHLMVTRSLKLVPVAVVAPFQYTLLLWGIVMGIIFFGDWPAPHIVLGSCIIVVAGLFILHRKANSGKGLSEAEVPRDLV
jgi:S-adenosylmethionine uptake transporter